LYGINRHNNSLVLFDRFSMQNANAVVFATSGAGKSYTVKLEIIRSMMMGTDVIVIDPEMEYRQLTDATGGTYINVSLASDAKVNPFDLPRPKGDETSVEDILRSAVITLKGLLRIMIGKPMGEAGILGFTPEEDSILDRALLEAYAKKDITADLPSLESVAEYPILDDLLDVLEGMEGAANLVARLQKFTSGTFSGLLNSPTTVEMRNQLVVFSVRDLEDELRPMAIYTIVNYIWNVVRSERKKRILCIDEAWWLMQNQDSAKFIFALVKRARKYYLGVTTITQDVNDFLSSQYGQAIVTNSSMQILLKQSSAGVDLIAKTFNLTESEKYLLLEAAVGEGIFFAGQKHAAMKVVASYTEDQIITTNPQQLLEQERARAEFQKSLSAAAPGAEPAKT
jgi:type IV secretory pathway VirB4 component